MAILERFYSNFGDFGRDLAILERLRRFRMGFGGFGRVFAFLATYPSTCRYGVVVKASVFGSGDLRYRAVRIPLVAFFCFFVTFSLVLGGILRRFVYNFWAVLGLVFAHFVQYFWAVSGPFFPHFVHSFLAHFGASKVCRENAFFIKK